MNLLPTRMILSFFMSASFPAADGSDAMVYKEEVVDYFL